MSKYLAIIVVSLLATSGVGRLAMPVSASGYPLGCPKPGSGRLPLLAGRIVIGPGGKILSLSPHPTPLCPQFPGVLAVVPGTRLTVAVSPLHIFDQDHVLARSRPYHVRVCNGPGLAFQVVRTGHVRLRSATLHLTVLAANPVS